MDLPLEPSGFDQPGHRAAHRDLVHRGALGHLVGRQVGVAPQHGHHPPFGDAQGEALDVNPRYRAADPVGQHRQPVRQEVLEVEFGMGGGAAPRVIHAALCLVYGFM